MKENKKCPACQEHIELLRLKVENSELRKLLAQAEKDKIAVRDEAHRIFREFKRQGYLVD